MRKTDTPITRAEHEEFRRRMEESFRRTDERIDNIENIVGCVQEMVVELKHMREDMNAISSKVDEIEKKPARRWETVIAAVLGALGGAVGAAIAAFFIG